MGIVGFDQFQQLRRRGMLLVGVVQLQLVVVQLGQRRRGWRGLRLVPQQYRPQPNFLAGADRVHLERVTRGERDRPFRIGADADEPVRVVRVGFEHEWYRGLAGGEPCPAWGPVLICHVGLAGFEPASSASRTQRATKLCHNP